MILKLVSVEPKEEVKMVPAFPRHLKTLYNDHEDNDNDDNDYDDDDEEYYGYEEKGNSCCVSAALF